VSTGTAVASVRVVDRSLGFALHDDATSETHATSMKRHTVKA
jgi:hypothetical protein